jgi:hypothetical protein
MTAAQIVRTLSAVPFAKFTMHLADGREVIIRHPECVQLVGGGRVAQVTVRDEGVPESIDVLMIVSLRPLQ